MKKTQKFTRLLSEIRKIALFLMIFSVFLQNGQADELKIQDGLWKNIADSFSGSNLLLHAAGIASTPIIIETNTDSDVHSRVKGGADIFSMPGAILGSGLVTAGVATHLYFKGKSKEDKKTVGAAFVMAQATVITLTYISILKGLTGRPHPDNESDKPMSEQSREFRFGFLRGGIFHGWPSGHVSHTVAVTSALAHYYPEKPWMTWMSVGLSGYMMYSVSATNDGQMHWFSEAVAGAFMGYAIGSTVGKNFRKRVEDLNEPEKSEVSWFPYVSPGTIGATAFYRF